ncbi:hypothetical protein [Stutzerimonas stutzeri]|uniref:hypothetical protein n=1 Tax=Stutzerimonas stutzeri TaxID=316 RepID=UPI0015E383BD|nr:hypothetical protein [Stutzerimonas stutzeri]MBA1280412.1 hypothetical protein [Stutzerimonas stutzeri]
MDISAFLRTGKTVVHASRNSLLAKAGAALVLSLALSAGAQAEGRVNNVTELVPPTDIISIFYQGLVAPDDSRLVVVSSRSADMSRILNTMPNVFAQTLALRAAKAGIHQVDAESFIEAVGKHDDEAFTYRLNGSTMFGLGKQQSVCFINAAEAVYSQLYRTADGSLFYTAEAPGTIPSVHSADEALFVATIHELYHCAAVPFYRESAASTLGADAAVYGAAVDEMLADLAVVLNYAVQDGNFQNGLATIRGMRATALNDIEHNTEDMLEYVLSHLRADDFVGMPSHEIMGVVNSVARELDPIHNQDLKAIFATSATEKVALAERLIGPDEGITAELEGVHSALGTSSESANPDARAAKLVDAVISLNVKNAGLQRKLGETGVEAMTNLADSFGIQLPMYQLARSAVFDVKASDGSLSSPWSADSALKATNRFSALFEAHQQSLEQSAKSETQISMRN